MAKRQPCSPCGYGVSPAAPAVRLPEPDTCPSCPFHMLCASPRDASVCMCVCQWWRRWRVWACACARASGGVVVRVFVRKGGVVLRELGACGRSSLGAAPRCRCVSESLKGLCRGISGGFCALQSLMLIVEGKQRWQLHLYKVFRRSLRSTWISRGSWRNFCCSSHIDGHEVEKK